MSNKILARFSRLTSGAKIIPEVEGLRFIAIFTVFVFHCYSELLYRHSDRFIHSSLERGMASVFSTFGIAVQIFFTISGFILALRFAQHFLGGAPPISLRAYFLRRLTRLEPPYIIALILTVPLAIAMARHLGRTTFLLPNFLASMIYAHGAIFRDRSMINGVAWSLEVEVQFYVLAPLLALVYKLRSFRLRCIVYIAVACLAMTWQHSHSTFVDSLFLPAYLQFFVTGFFLADIYVTRWKNSPATDRRNDLLSLIGWPAIPVVVLLGGWYLFLLPVVMIVAFTGAFTGTLTRRILSNAWITTIGGMCYTIYLYHYSILIVVSRLTFHLFYGNSFILNFIVQFILLGGITLVTCFLLFALFERPFMDKRWTQRAANYLRTVRAEFAPSAKQKAK